MEGRGGEAGVPAYGGACCIVSSEGHLEDTLRSSERMYASLCRARYKRDCVNERKIGFIVCIFSVVKFFLSFVFLYCLFGFSEV
jgi:hypothetical protein